MLDDSPCGENASFEFAFITVNSFNFGESLGSAYIDPQPTVMDSAHLACLNCSEQKRQ
jgi:hypothetical protein